MKRLIIFISVALATTAMLSGQSSDTKRGWNLGALPTITFDTDLGFQYGALINLFNYGEGDIFPDYYQSLYFEVSRFTKGSGINRFMFDSDHLIPGVRYTVDLSYLTDRAYDFYGFNGYEAVYNRKWEDDSSEDYRSRMFYRHDRTYFRFKNDFEGSLYGKGLKWNAGFNIQRFTTGLVDIDRLNEGREVSDQLPAHEEVPGLFQLYNEWGVIPDDEFGGGWVNTVKAGLTFDTRDNRANPMSGVWSEAGIELSAGLFGSSNSFSKLYMTHRQYFTIIENDLSFAYRVGYQTTLTGSTPFYYQTQLIVSQLRGATSEGLGGARSIRGVLRNRVVGDGFLYGNLELRYKAIRFNFINQSFYIGLNGFADFGMVTTRIDYDIPDMPDNDASLFFNPGGEKMRYSLGSGLRIVMNKNFIIAADLGKAINDQDGNIGFYMGLNYLF